MRALLVKDLRILRRSPLLVGLLVVYPVALALLIGFALSKGPDRPRVAFLNEAALADRPVSVGGRTIDATAFGRRLERGVEAVPVRSRAEAIAKVRSGEVLAAVVLPEELGVRLSSGRQPRIETFYNAEDPVKARFVESTLKARLADANLALSKAISENALRYINLLRDGGTIAAFGQDADVLGLVRAREILRREIAALPAGSPRRAELARVARFAGLAIDNLGATGNVLRTVRSPLAVSRTVVEGRRTPLDTYAAAVAVAISLMFVTVLLAAGALALEREERTFARLVRGMVTRAALLTEKIVLAALCATAVALAMTCGLAAFVHLDWARAGAWAVAIAAGALGFGALGVAIGALAREVRAASLLAFLLSLPIAFLALIPSGAVDHTLYQGTRVVSALFPFKPALTALDAAFNAGDGLALAVAHLLGLTLAFAALARVGLRRFA